MAEIKKINTDLQIESALRDGNGSPGNNGQILSSTGTATDWISLSEIQGVDGSGTANYIAKWLDTDTITSSIIYDDGTKIGLGTTSPQSKLHIETGSGGTYNPNTNHDDVTIEGSGNIGLQLFSPNSSYQYIAFGDPDSVNAGYLRYYHGANEMVFRTSNSDKMVITSSGNVGIGTTSPGTKLQISTTMSSTPTSNIFLDVDGSNVTGGGGSIIFGTSASAGTPSTYNAKITGTRVSGGAGGDSQLGFWTTLVSDTNVPQERMTITKEGDVGIGTTSPSEKLEVLGSIKVSTAYPRIYLADTQGVPRTFSIGTSNEDLIINSGSTDVLSILGASGNVGIGTTNPGYKLDVEGDVQINETLIAKSGADLILQARSSQVVGINSNGTRTMTLDASNNVGIGTTSPSALLDVNGGAVFNKQLATNNTNGAAKAFIHVNSGSGSAKFKVYKNVSTVDGYACFRIDRAYDYGSNDQMIQEVVYQRRTTTKNVKFKYEGDVATADDVYLEFYELTDGTVEAWVCHDDFAQVGVSITYFENTGDTYPTPSSGTPTGTLIYSTNPDTETPNWDSYQGDGYFSGNVGIGTTSPQDLLHLSADSPVLRLTNTVDTGKSSIEFWDNQSGTNQHGEISYDDNSNLFGLQGNANGIVFRANNTFPGSELMRLNGSGNLGIGTTSPSKKLDVAGDWILDGITGGHFENYTYGSQLDISEITSGGWARANRIVTSDSDAYVFSGVLGDDTTLTRAYWTIGSSSDPTGYTYSNGIILLKNGNVGIGTTNPGYTLDVNGTLHSSNITLADGIYHEGDTNTYINFLSDTIQMATAGSVRAYINSSGNVGIGTTSPSARLQVTASGLGAKIHSSQTTGLEVSGGGNSQDIARFQNVAGYTKVTIDTDGNVGIGTTDPGTKLDVAVSETGKTWVDYAGTVGTFERNGDSNINIVSSNTGNGGVWFGDTDSMVRGRIRYEHTNDKMEFWTSNSEKVTIEGGGNVGIGTTSPSEKLEVNGTVKATAATDAYKGYIKNTITCTPLMKSANTNYNYIPYNTTAFGSTPDYFNRMVTPYDGRVKKIILRHISGVTPTATGMKFKKEVNGTVSTTEYTATVTGGASTSFTAIYNFANSDFTFSEGDSIGILAKATGGTGEISGASAQIIVEYNIT